MKSSKTATLKWFVVFAVVFAFALPLCGRTRALAAGTYRVSVASNYLALRNAKAFDRSNEIGELYSGDTVELQDASDPTYWYVYSPKHGLYGYVNKDYLVAVDTTPSTPAVSGASWTVSVTSGYLALRNAKAYDSSNEIGQLYSGDTVQLQDSSDSTYWYVYSPKLGKYGYVNKAYLIAPAGSAPAGGSSGWTVSVTSGYLALRNAKAYDSSNEIGQLYTGDTVNVQDSSDSTYWYVYSPKYGKYGYVNRAYLIAPAGSADWTVSVTSGYLALRNAKAFDRSNEIGQLYTGDTVQIQDSSDSTYWYVYSPKLGKYGYVNKSYLIAPAAAAPAPAPAPSYPTYTVRVDKNYLALRNAKAFDRSNEIGELYTGDTVQVQDSSDGTYWYVYSPKLNKYGYVNRNYLY